MARRTGGWAVHARRLSALVLATAALLGVVAGPASADASRAPVPSLPDGRVLVLGDSISWQQCDGDQQVVLPRVGLLSARDGGCYGWSGATTAEMRELVDNPGWAAPRLGPGRPAPRFGLRQRLDAADLLVLGLGTNDAVRERDAYDRARWPAGDGAWPYFHVPLANGEFARQVDWFLQQARGRPVLWVDVGTRTPEPVFAASAVQYDAALVAAEARWPNLTVLRWSDRVRADGALLKDEAHVSDAGWAARWAMVTDAVLRTERPGVERFVAALHRSLLGREATPAEVALRADQLQQLHVSRGALGDQLAHSPEYLGGEVTRLYREILRREPDPAGHRFWLETLRSRRLLVASLAAQLYASPERHAAAGGTDHAWLAGLYREVLRREPDPAGLDYWAGTARARGRAAVATAFYASPESLAARVAQRYRTLLAREPEPGGTQYWSPVVAVHGELALTGVLTASPEYYRRAARP